MQKLVSIVFLALFSSLQAGFEPVSLHFSKEDVKLVKNKSDEISFTVKGGQPIAKPGAPDIPYYQILVVLPEGQKATQINVKSVEEESFLSNVRIKPFEPLRFPGISYNKVKRDTSFKSQAVWPTRVIRLVGTQYMRGIPIAVIRIYPLRFRPQERSISLLKEIEFNVIYRAGGKGIKPLKQSRIATEAIKNLLKGRVYNPERLINLDHSFGDGHAPHVSLLPKPGDSPIAQVVVTTDELASQWIEFAHYRTLLGIPTVVRSISLIESNYPGVDRAEELRNFVRDAYQDWGIVFLILGADAPEIPVRLIHAEVPGYPEPLFTNLPSAYYFGCLDGNWNADGDTMFAEEEDEVDFLPEVLVGRVPALDSEDVENYIRKVKTYEMNPGNGDFTYLLKGLFAGSDLVRVGDGCSISEEVSTHLPSYFERGYICEDESQSPETQEFIDSLYSGFNYTVIHAHGNFFDFNICKTPTHSFSIIDADQMNNWWNASIIRLASCEPLGFDYDCIGEHMICSEGCAVGLLGGSRLTFSEYSARYQSAFFDSLFINGVNRLGVNFYSGALEFVPAPDTFSYLWYIYPSYVLMGDPALLMWDTLPVVSSVTFSPETLFTDADTLEIVVKNAENDLPIEGVNVVVYKEEEIFNSCYTNLKGKASIPIRPVSPGTLSVSISEGGVLSKIYHIPVKSTPISVSISGLLLEDTDGDSIAEPQETLSLYPIIKNHGVNNTGPFDVFLDVLNGASHVTLIKDTIGLSGLNPGDSLISPSKFVILASPFFPDSSPVILKLSAVQGETLRIDTQSVILRSPHITHYGHRVSEDSSYFHLYVSLRNRGLGDGMGVLGLLSAEGAYFIKDSVFFGDISGHKILPDTNTSPFVFESNDSIQNLIFTMKIEDIRGLVDSFRFRVKNPESPQDLGIKPFIGGIRINWDPIVSPEDIGYFIYRSIDSASGFIRLNIDPFPMAYYEDPHVTSGVKYFYRISLVDSFWNESSPSNVIAAYTIPALHHGWPKYVGPSSSTPLVAEITEGNQGLEILESGRDGYLRLFDKAGNLMPGWPIYIGGNITGSPAAGDIDGDGDLEIVASTWGDTNSVFAFEKDGSSVKGWPRPITEGHNRENEGVYAPPVISDLDQNDSSEVIVRTMSGKIYIWKGNGEGYKNASGFFYDLKENNWSLSALSVGDVDGNGYPDIVAGTSLGELHVLDRDGEELPGFPVKGLTPIKAATVIADFFPDSGGLEILAIGVDKTWLLDSKGNVLSGWPISTPPIVYSWYLNPSVADIDRDGHLDILLNSNQGLFVYNRFGKLIDTLYFEGGSSSSPAVIDLNLDGKPSVFIGSEGGGIQGFEMPTGNILPGFPVPIGGEILTTPVLADIDGNGSIDLLSHGGAGKMWVFDLESPYQIDSLHFQWPTHRHDIWRTGCYSTPQIGINIIERKAFSSHKGDKIEFYPLYPDPFTQRLKIRFYLPNKTELSLRVFDVTGRAVRTLREGILSRGGYVFYWDGKDKKHNLLSNGVYFVTMEVKGHDYTQKAILLKN